MPCTVVKVNGITAIVRHAEPRRRRCHLRDGHGHACAQEVGYQCDWKLGGGKTCDKYLCAEHALEVAPGKHLCPEHWLAYGDWLDKRRGAG